MNELKNKVIILGDVRIKIGNIKNYGIAYENRLYWKVYRKKEASFWKDLFGYSEYEWKKEIRRIKDNEQVKTIDLGSVFWKSYESVFVSDNGNLLNAQRVQRRYLNENDQPGSDLRIARENSLGTDALLASDAMLLRKDKYLYVTTYQNDNFVFFDCESDFDIDEKCNELDSILSMD